MRIRKTLKWCEAEAVRWFIDARYYEDDFQNLQCETVYWEGDAKDEAVEWRGKVTYTMGYLGDDYMFEAFAGLNKDGELVLYYMDWGDELELAGDESLAWVVTWRQSAQFLRRFEHIIETLRINAKDIVDKTLKGD